MAVNNRFCAAWSAAWPRASVATNMFGKLGSAVVSGAKKVGEAHVAVGSAVADAGKSAVSAVVDSKGDPGSRYCRVGCR